MDRTGYTATVDIHRSHPFGTARRELPLTRVKRYKISIANRNFRSRGFEVRISRRFDGCKLQAFGPQSLTTPPIQSCTVCAKYAPSQTMVD
jgi:hypothetical protein